MAAEWKKASGRKSCFRSRTRSKHDNIRSNHGGVTEGSSRRTRAPADRDRNWRRSAPRKFLVYAEKNAIRQAIEKIPSEQKFCHWLRDYFRTQNVSHVAAVAYAVHRCAEKDDIRLCEALLRQIRNEDVIKRIVNTHESRSEYTPLCRAVFRGSVRMIKFLVSQGADVNFINSHGENLMNALDAGQEEYEKTQPDNSIFTRDRYTQCRNFITQRQRYLQMLAARKEQPPPKRWKPRRQHAIVIQQWFRKVRCVQETDN